MENLKTQEHCFTRLISGASGIFVSLGVESRTLFQVGAPRALSLNVEFAGCPLDFLFFSFQCCVWDITTMPYQFYHGSLTEGLIRNRRSDQR